MRSCRAFSLFELMIALAVLGVLSSIAIAAYTRQRSAIEDTQCRYNAAMLSQTCLCAQVAGVDLGTNEELPTTVQRLLEGVVAQTGSFASHEFKVDGIKAGTLPHVLYYLELRDGALVYRADRASPVD